MFQHNGQTRITSTAGSPKTGRPRSDRCVLARRYHHVLVHEGGWGMDLDPHTGEVLVTRPDGGRYQLPRGRSPSWNGPATTTS